MKWGFTTFSFGVYPPAAAMYFSQKQVEQIRVYQPDHYMIHPENQRFPGFKVRLERK